MSKLGFQIPFRLNIWNDS